MIDFDVSKVELLYGGNTKMLVKFILTIVTQLIFYYF